ncbi:MAG: DUF2892 domain-containing protein [Verrucomicrobia bacterium]|nr:DUF2892 domain-containing protein [Verrucomicrobiota bacterium]
MKFKLPKNIDASGRWIRGSIGILLLTYAYAKMSWIALIFGLFTLFEAAFSWCIVYHILGKSSCPIKKK